MALAWIGLGSNVSNQLGDPRELLCAAVAGLRQLGDVRVSSLYSSAPMGPQDQPDYLNAAAVVDTDLAPYELLAYLHTLEQAAGRQRVRRWGERSLDLDILLMQGVQMQQPDLIIPHIGVMQRAFVVQPLLDLDDALQVDGIYLRDLAIAQSTEGIRRIEQSQWADAPI